MRLSVDDIRDLFLRDYAPPAPLNGDSDLLPLPVVPFTISMEMIAQAACSLFGNPGQLIYFVQYRGYRWNAPDQGETSLRICAEAMSSASDGISTAIVRIFVMSDATSDGMEQVFEGWADVGSAFPAALLVRPIDFSAPQAVHYTRDMLYGDTRPENVRHASLFHGPRFQGVIGLRRWSTDGIEADLAVLRRNELFFGVSEPSLATDQFSLMPQDSWSVTGWLNVSASI